MRPALRFWSLSFGLAAVVGAAGGCADLWVERPPDPSRLVACSESVDPGRHDRLTVPSAGIGSNMTVRLNHAGEGFAWICDDEPQAKSSYGRTYEMSALHVCIVDDPEAMSAGAAGWRWLLDQLSLTRKPWKVVFLPKAFFRTDPVEVDEELLDLADLLAGERVALAFAPGNNSYVRTARIGETNAISTQYILLPRASSGALGAAPPWVARALAGPCVGILDADPWQLRWSVQGAGGEMKDRVDLFPEGAGAYVSRVYSLNEILASRRLEPGSENEEKQAP